METTARYSGLRVCRLGMVFVGVVAALLSACGKRAEETRAESSLSDEVTGTWFAYRDNVIENMWTFRRDGTCINDGWPSASLAPGNPTLPYHLEGSYRVSPERITVVFLLEGGAQNTVYLDNPDVTMNRLVYSVGNTPVVFLRERAAIGQEVGGVAEQAPADETLPQKLVGSWVALTGGFPANTWKFNEDGTFLNEGWARMNPRTLLVRRLHQVAGRYTVSGRRVILANEKLLQFDPETNRVNVEVPISERIVLYDVVVSKGRLVYTNEVGLPVAFRPGTVTPTNW